VVAYRVKNIQAYSFAAVYRMNFVIFLCVTLKLFYLSFVPLPALNPGDATVFSEDFIANFLFIESVRVLKIMLMLEDFMTKTWWLILYNASA